jgi:DDE family transposase
MSTEAEIRARFQLLQPDLRGRLVRLWAAAEAATLGRGGSKLVSAATGITLARIAAGRRELRGQAPPPRIPSARKRRGQFWEDKDPTLLSDLERLLSDQVAGNPMNGEKWVRSSTRRLRDQLREMGHPVGHCTVHRLLKKLKFSLRANQRRRGGSRKLGRDEQFQHIASQRKSFAERGLPILSVDTKHKELIGDFRNPGKAWCREASKVNEHDFTSTAEYRAVPFGIYDVSRNQGNVTVGISNDTPEFAVNALARWWDEEAKIAYPHAAELLILADCGGTNGCRCKAWKLELQEKLCDRFGLTVTVCHYPPGCSKWNPIEHRLFSQISINWAGRPLRTLAVMLGISAGPPRPPG